MAVLTTTAGQFEWWDLMQGLATDPPLEGCVLRTDIARERIEARDW